ncbi:hypothetical protein E1263_07385 [Kribbella antibiotica]|uniref:MobA-like NTP transferase domain-containing protein n=1 Tax=Kribbella antibiotica TaxID=190195 RepID=A0A4R4ZRV5_9ACTN|nr:hypothetical protein E1263_07385 [Kribbella antibiotica]
MTKGAITGVVLAAGEGTRLKEAWPSTPKPLVPVCGEPMIGRLLRLLDRGDLDSLVVVSRATDPDVGRFVRDLDLATPTTSVECVTSGTLESLVAGLGAVTTERVLIVLADAVFPESEFVRFLSRISSFEKAQATGIQWVRDRRPEDSRSEQGVRVHPSGRIAEIGRALALEPVISQGVLLYNRPLLGLATGAAAEGATGLSDFLPFVVRKSYVSIYAYRCDRVRDVDNEDDRRAVERYCC